MMGANTCYFDGTNPNDASAVLYKISEENWAAIGCDVGGIPMFSFGTGPGDRTIYRLDRTGITVNGALLSGYLKETIGISLDNSSDIPADSIRYFQQSVHKDGYICLGIVGATTKGGNNYTYAAVLDAYINEDERLWGRVYNFSKEGTATNITAYIDVLYQNIY